MMVRRNRIDVSRRQIAANDALEKSLSDADELVLLSDKVTESTEMIKKLRRENNFALRMNLAYKGCD